MWVEKEIDVLLRKWLLWEAYLECPHNMTEEYISGFSRNLILRMLGAQVGHGGFLVPFALSLHPMQSLCVHRLCVLQANMNPFEPRWFSF